MPLPTSPRFALAVALFAAMLLGAGLPAAQAFTLQEGSGSVSADDQSFLYPDRGAPAAGDGQTKGFKYEDGMTTYKDGNTSFSFGRKPSFNERYNADHMFDPLGKPADVR